MFGFYSFTLEPHKDTAGSLGKRYAEVYGIGPGWLFRDG